MAYKDADIVIKAEGGVTRGLFVEGIRDALYSEERNVVEGRRLIVKDWSFMMADDVYFNRSFDYEWMRIWMECEEMRGY